jgi:hypothetical protein
VFSAGIVAQASAFSKRIEMMSAIRFPDAGGPDCRRIPLGLIMV